MKKILVIVVAMLAMFASAIEIPKASAKALGVTRGKSFSEGIVYVNGKYIEPPYVVERWGCGIRINGQNVIAEVVPWSEFVKTQPGAKVTKSEAPAAGEEAEEEEEEDDLDDAYEEDDDDSSLDDLFDDDPKPAKKAAAKKPAKKAAKKAPKKPKATVSYTLTGPFQPNDASKKLVARVNKTRTEINSKLLNGYVIFFGDKYARVTADAHSAELILEKLGDIQNKSKSASELLSSARSAGMVYLTGPVAGDLYRNKIDYIKLQQRREKWKKDRELKKMLNGSGRGSLY